MTPHCLSISHFTKDEIVNILILAQKMKAELKATGQNQPVLHSKTLAMIFEKPSLRTRVSFEVGMTQLGGHAIYLGPSEIGLGQREAISDVSKVLSSMADIIMARVFDHQVLVELSTHSQVPVINALSDLEHPCQTLADLLTIQEVKGSLTDLKITFVGDGDNNVAHSLALAAANLGLHFSVAAPDGYLLHSDIAAQCHLINET
ncbi:MAG TPA: ornithine carbamoyltransferase, partial [Patescibacteria group bacterium]